MRHMIDTGIELAQHVDPYMDRLGVDAVGRVPDLVLLTELQRSHLVAVPFENLDVYHRRPVRTDVSWSVPKITRHGRGGWCFELNGAFGWLLRQLGFRVDYVSCRVRGDDGWGPDLDHCALLVHLDDTRWFVDVGFGDCCMVPIPLMPGETAVFHVMFVAASTAMSSLLPNATSRGAGTSNYGATGHR